MTNGKRLRICYVLKRYPRFSETFIVNEILALEAHGVAINIVALKPPNEGVFHENLSRVKASVTYLPQLSQSPSKFFDSLSTAIRDYGLQVVGDLFDQDVAELEHGVRVAKIATDFGADIIHAHFATSAASIARIAAHLSAIPFTVTAHAKDIFHQDVDLRALNERLSDAARIVTVSEFNVGHLAKTFPHCRQKISRIYNGMPLDSLPIRGTGSSRSRILTVGRLIEKKGIQDLLHAIAILKAEFPSLQCDVVGDGPLRESLTNLALRLGLATQVTFHGILPQHEVHQLMVEADAFVAPCVVSEDGDRDGLPTVLLEAMAIGTPCISTPVTGIPEVVVHRETGLLVPEHDPESIASACAELFSNAELSISLSHAAFLLIKTQFDITFNTRELIGMWQSIGNSTTEAVA